MSEQRKKVVLAYSGGLDTSVAIKWIPEKYNMDVVTVTIDLGAVKDLDGIREKALKIGAKKAIVIDAKDTFVKYFIFPALQSGALYEGDYPLATALGRPLIAKLLADVAHEEKADAVAAGGCGLLVGSPAAGWGVASGAEAAAGTAACALPPKASRTSIETLAAKSTEVS